MAAASVPPSWLSGQANADLAEKVDHLLQTPLHALLVGHRLPHLALRSLLGILDEGEVAKSGLTRLPSKPAKTVSSA
ncbi:MAG: hypothetical protein OXG37_12430 [Actinomycetia bacterium]|nr:hypothetical protein [Actinomycetes bacterium]